MKRKAIIEVSTKHLEQVPGEVAKWFSELEILVLDVEHLLHRKVSRYFVYSKSLPETELGEMLTVYNFEISPEGVRLEKA